MPDTDIGRLTYHEDLEDSSGKTMISKQLKSENHNTSSTLPSQEVDVDMNGAPVRSAGPKTMFFPTGTRVIMIFSVMAVIQ